MIKKSIYFIGIITIISLFICPTLCAYSETYEYNEDDDFEINPNDYIPDAIREQLNDNDSATDNQCGKLILVLITRFVNDNKEHFSLLVLSLFAIIIFTTLLIRTTNINDNTKRLLIILSIILVIITHFNTILENASNLLNDLHELVSSITPAISSVLLLSGSSFTATASTAALSMVISIIEYVFSTLLFPFATLTLSLFLTERLSPSFGALGLTKSLKKNLVSIIVFLFSFLLAIIALNGSLASSKDSASMRGIKFAAANVIPIIGASVGEAMKTVSAGISGVKNTLGLASLYAVLSVSIPPILRLIIYKLALKLSSIFASLLNVQEASATIDGVVDIIDILLAILTAVTVISFFPIFIFTNTLSL